MLFVMLSLIAEESYDTENVSTDSTFYQLAKRVDVTGVDRFSIIIKNYGDGDCDATYELRCYPDNTLSDYIYYGVATADSADVLIDTLATFTTNVIGEKIYNVTDGSSGTITDTTGTTIYATLSGGTDNSWDTGDFYRIVRPWNYYSMASASLAADEQDVFEIQNYYNRIDLFIKKTAAGDSTATLKYIYNFKKYK